MVDFSKRLEIHPDTLLREIGEESVLLNLSSASYYGLNPTGTHMWQVVTTTDTIEKAFALLLETYDVEPERLRRDFEDFLEDLLKNGLVTLHDT